MSVLFTCLQVLKHVFLRCLKYPGEYFDELFALQIVDSPRHSRQKQSDPDVQVSLELIAISPFAEEFSDNIRLVIVPRFIGNLSTQASKLPERVVLVLGRFSSLLFGRHYPSIEGPLFRATAISRGRGLDDPSLLCRGTPFLVLARVSDELTYSLFVILVDIFESWRE